LKWINWGSMKSRSVPKNILAGAEPLFFGAYSY
jgi:hypothetical protein